MILSVTQNPSERQLSMYIKIPVNMNHIYWDFILTTPIIDKLIKN